MAAAFSLRCLTRKCVADGRSARRSGASGTFPVEREISLMSNNNFDNCPQLIKNETRSSHCPLCGGNNIYFADIILYRSPVLFSTTEIQLSSQPQLWHCGTCFSWFTQNIVSEEDATNLYRSGNSNKKWVAEPFNASKSRDILASISSLFCSGMKILDVGCNTGEFLDYANGFGLCTYGVEPSVASGQSCKEKGHKIYSSLNEVDELFDIISIFDVIEHLHNPTKFISEVHRLLKSDGRMVIITGDNQSFTAKRFRANWWYLRAPEHIIFPSEKYMQSLPGFKILERRLVYASKGYEPSTSDWIRGTLKTLTKSGEGLPLTGPDHQLVVLQRTQVSNRK